MEPEFGSIATIKDMLNPEDAEKFLAEYHKRKEVFDQKKELREAQRQAYGETKHKIYLKKFLLSKNIR